MKKLAIYILTITILTHSSCTKDLPCSIDRYLGTHRIKSRLQEPKFATIRRGNEQNQIIFNAGSQNYTFVIDEVNPCQASYEGSNYGFGLIKPYGEMTIDNNCIRVSIRNYLLVLPIDSKYTLVL